MVRCCYMIYVYTKKKPSLPSPRSFSARRGNASIPLLSCFFFSSVAVHGGVAREGHVFAPERQKDGEAAEDDEEEEGEGRDGARGAGFPARGLPGVRLEDREEHELLLVCGRGWYGGG